MTTKRTITVEGYGAKDVTISNGGHSGRAFVPREWAGKKAIVILLEPLE
jgi:putative transposon-encoded protein